MYPQKRPHRLARAPSSCFVKYLSPSCSKTFLRPCAAQRGRLNASRRRGSSEALLCETLREAVASNTKNNRDRSIQGLNVLHTVWPIHISVTVGEAKPGA